MLIPLGFFGVAAGGSYELIQSVFLSTDNAALTFSSIPQTYKHLEIRVVGRTTTGSTETDLGIYFNGDAGANYYYHRFVAYGTGNFTDNANSNAIYGRGITTGAATPPSESFGGSIWSIPNYAATNQTKTVRIIGGQTNNTQRYLSLNSGMWNNTSAITSFTFARGLVAGSRVSLYGIKGQ